MNNQVVSSINDLLKGVNAVRDEWGSDTELWFRGEPKKHRDPNKKILPLLPKLFRNYERKEFSELNLLQEFRRKSPTLGLPYIPERGYTDQWLFLAQHVGLPTRLLDWTEGLMIALHFALYTDHIGAVVWMLHPLSLNLFSVKELNNDINPLTWFREGSISLNKDDLRVINNFILNDGNPDMQQTRENIGSFNINMAWEDGNTGTALPVAIHPTNIHPRMSSQISRFTIHGMIERGMDKLDIGPNILRKFEINDDFIPEI